MQCVDCVPHPHVPLRKTFRFYTRDAARDSPSEPCRGGTITVIQPTWLIVGDSACCWDFVEKLEVRADSLSALC